MSSKFDFTCLLSVQDKIGLNKLSGYVSLTGNFQAPFNFVDGPNSDLRISLPTFPYPSIMHPVVSIPCRLVENENAFLF